MKVYIIWCQENEKGRTIHFLGKKIKASVKIDTFVGSTIFRLKPERIYKKIRMDLHLYSTIFRLKLSRELDDFEVRKNLHSTIFRLKLMFGENGDKVVLEFTFYYI